MSDQNYPPMTDIMDVPLAEGDKVAFSATEGQSGVLRIGKILEIIYKDRTVFNHNLKKYVPGPPERILKIEWNQDVAGRPPAKPTKVQHYSNKILRLGP